MNIELKKKIIISLFALLIFLATVFYFIIMPAINDINQLADNIGNQRADVEKKYQQGLSFKKLYNNLKEIESQLKKIDQVFISKNRELEFITTIEDIAAKNQLRQKINLKPEHADEKIFQKNILLLITEGEFKKQIQYLHDLETLSYYINIRNIELSASEKIISLDRPNDNEIMTSMSIAADTYWR